MGAAPLVVVMGVSGVGKSTIASALAARLGVASADGDSFHTTANIAGMRAGRPLTDFDRADWLDDIGRWLAEHDSAGGVISCSALKRSYRDQLRSAAPRTTFVHLAADHDTILARMQSRDHFMPPSLLVSQEEILEPLGSDEAGRTYDSTSSPSSIVEALTHDMCRDDPTADRDNLH